MPRRSVVFTGSLVLLTAAGVFTLARCLLPARKVARFPMPPVVMNENSARSVMPYDTNGIHEAAGRGDIAQVTRLLEADPASVNLGQETGWTPLLSAASRGQTAMVALLLARGAAVNPRLARQSPLQAAVEARSREVVALLLAHGASVNAADVSGQTALHVAARLGCFDIAALLLDHDAAPDARDRIQQTPLVVSLLAHHLDVARLLQKRGAAHSPVTDFYTAILAGDAAQVAVWLERDPSLLRTPLGQWRTPLLEAAAVGQETVAAVLLDKGADINSGQKSGNMPLREAIRAKQTKTVALFLARGASVNAADAYGTTPLHVAARTGDTDVLQLLLDKGANVNAQGDEGFTPLASATAAYSLDRVVMLVRRGAVVRNASGAWALLESAAHEDKRIARFLVLHGADVNAKNREGWTPLLRSLIAPDKAFVVLLMRRGADVNAADKNQETPLMLAILRRRTDIAALLLSHHADPNAADREGATMLHYAVRYASTDMVRLLLDNGARVNARTRDGVSPLQEARDEKTKALLEARGGVGATWEIYDALLKQDMGRVKELIRREPSLADVRQPDWGSPLFAALPHRDLMALLLVHGADVNARKNGGQTPLSEAASYKGDKDTVQFLIDKGADVNSRDTSGNTALSNAVYREDAAIVARLIAAGADIKTPRENGETLLHLAIYRGSTEVIERLLARGADINAHNSKGETPLLQAIHMKGTVPHTGTNVTSPNMMASFLIWKGADASLKDAQGRTPLEEAERLNQRDIVALLRAPGGRLPRAEAVNQFFMAIFLGNIPTASELLKRDPSLVHAADVVGQSVLHQAIRMHRPEMVSWLLAHGADINARNRFGETPLYFTLSGDPAGAALLLDAGANLEARNETGQTPLLYALSISGEDRTKSTAHPVPYPDIRIVTLMLARGADVQAHDARGGTAEQLARQKGRSDILALLRHAASKTTTKQETEPHP